MTLDYKEGAKEEGFEAAEWYEIRREGLAHRFLTEWNRAENRLLADPGRNREATDDHLRLCRFKAFPYSLVYRITEADTVQVVAVMHQHREPEYWRERQ